MKRPIPAILLSTDLDRRAPHLMIRADAARSF